MAQTLLTDDEMETWTRDRIAAELGHFRKLSQNERDHYAEALMRGIILLSSELEITDWPENLHLADVLEKYIGRRVKLK